MTTEGTEAGGALDVVCGSEVGRNLQIAADGRRTPLVDTAKHKGGTIRGTLPAGWREAALYVTTPEHQRFMRLAPADEDAEIVHGMMRVEGRFRVVEVVNNGRAAREAWRAFAARE